jgi:hypothetical protein
MSIDTDYHNRLDWLAQLMIDNPKSKMKKLQRESLKYYPLSSAQAVRNWMSWRTALAAADVADKKKKSNKRRNL